TSARLDSAAAYRLMLRRAAVVRDFACPAAAGPPPGLPLYSRLDSGSLELRPLLPCAGSRELSELAKQLRSGPSAGHMPTLKLGDRAVRLWDAASGCALLLWRPTRFAIGGNSRCARILLPGAAPAARVARGLDRLRVGLDCLHTPDGRGSAAAAAAASAAASRRRGASSTRRQPPSESPTVGAGGAPSFRRAVSQPPTPPPPP
uniref:IRS-type PTB domain-containing protein n=1 Tax=Macrostomum lignano TaxID=282301 RepID=A0A1I8HQE8_9PLAT